MAYGGTNEEVHYTKGWEYFVVCRGKTTSEGDEYRLPGGSSKNTDKTLKTPVKQ